MVVHFITEVTKNLTESFCLRNVSNVRELTKSKELEVSFPDANTLYESLDGWCLDEGEYRYKNEYPCKTVYIKCDRFKIRE